jgi:hypothetical protein
VIVVEAAVEVKLAVLTIYLFLVLMKGLWV